MGRCAVIFLNSIPAALLVGTLLGTLSGLGIGGGSLLVLYLTGLLSLEQRTAQGINLLFFLPAALVALGFRLKGGRVDWTRALPAIAAGVLTAGLCAWLAAKIDTALLRKAFGLLLLYTGASELLRSFRKEGPGKP